MNGSSQRMVSIICLKPGQTGCCVSINAQTASDIILILIRTFISSFSPSQPHSSSPLTSTNLYLHSFFDSSVTFFSFLTLPFHCLWILSLLSTTFILSSSFSHAVPGILPLSQKRSQLPKVFFQLFGSLRLHHLREIFHLSKRERAAGKI